MSNTGGEPTADAELKPGLAARIAHLLDIGRTDDAGQLIADGLAAHPSSTVLLRLAAHAEIQRGNPAAAVAAARSAVDQQPDSTANLLILARALRSSGDIDAGIEVADAAVRSAPHSGDAYHIRSLLLFSGAEVTVGHPRQQYLTRAMSDIERSIELDPSISTRFALRGLCLSLAGRHRAAEKSFRRALEIDPNDRLALNSLSDYATAIDDVGEARVHTAAGLRVNPQHRILRERIGKLASRRLIWPIWFASVPAFIGLMARASAHPKPPTAAVTASIGAATLCSVGFAWWAWRRTPMVERNSLVNGEARWKAWFGALGWLVLTVVGGASAFDIPFPGRDPRRPDPPVAGLVEAVLGIGTFLFYSIPVLMFIQWATGWSRRLNLTIAESRQPGAAAPCVATDPRPPRIPPTGIGPGTNMES